MCFSFQSVEGMVPVASSGRSMPVFTPMPTECAYLAMVSMPSLTGESVVVGVAGPGNGVVDVHLAVVLVAGEEAAEEGGSAGAVDVHVLRDALLQAGERHDDLEGGAGSELGLDGLVHQRVVGIGDELVPVIAADAHRELIGIEDGAAHHGENLAGVRVHGDEGAVVVPEAFSAARWISRSMVRRRLWPGLASSVPSLPDFAAVAVDDDVLGAIVAAQNAVVGRFDAGSAHDVAGFIKGVAGVVEHLLADLADVADEVGGKAVARIEAALLLAWFPARGARRCAPR